MRSLIRSYTASATLFLPAALLCCFTATALAQKPQFLAPDAENIVVIPVRDNFSMIATGGSNIAVQTGELGMVVVDSGNAEAAPEVLNTLAELSDLPPSYLINTSILPRHTAGNSAIHAIGEGVGGGAAILGMPIIGHTNGLTLLATRFADEIPFESWPNNAFFGPRKDLFFNGEGIEMLHQPSAITEGDLMVYFRKSDVLVTGSILDLSAYPHFYPELGGSLQGVIDALNNIIDITISEFNQQGGTLVIPGRGRLASESDIVEYRDMVTSVRDREQTMMNDGLSLEDIISARPALEYDGIYGSDAGEWTSSMFLEAVYNELL